jgi:PKD repeat protein
MLSTFDPSDFPSGGTWTCDCRWLVCEYSSGALWEINPGNGEIYIIGGGGRSCNGLAYDPCHNRLYGTDGSNLYEYDIDTGEQELIGSHNQPGKTMIALAINKLCDCYAWDINSNGNSTLFTIDLDSGEAIVVGDMGKNLTFAQDGAFNWENNNLYLAAYDTKGFLANCNVETGELTEIGNFEGDAQLTALAIPWYWGHPKPAFTWSPIHPDPCEKVFFNASDSYDPDGYITMYEWDWNNDGIIDENHTIPTTTHTFEEVGYYPVELWVIDNENKTSRKLKTVRVGNYPPEAPIIDGPSTGKTGIEYCWTFNYKEPDDDDILYYIDWGDGTFLYWFGPYSSPIEKCHIYQEVGIHNIRAKVKDIYGAESNWSKFSFEVPRTKTSRYLCFEWFLEQFSKFERLLNLLL